MDVMAMDEFLSLVFGGGHVVLPLLEAEVVQPMWINADAFLAGYGAAQAMPSPLFTFAAYLGAVMGPEPNGIADAAICLIAIFLPGFLLLIGALPFWDALGSARIKFRAILLPALTRARARTTADPMPLKGADINRDARSWLNGRAGGMAGPRPTGHHRPCRSLPTAGRTRKSTH